MEEAGDGGRWKLDKAIVIMAIHGQCLFITSHPSPGQDSNLHPCNGSVSAEEHRTLKQWLITHLITSSIKQARLFSFRGQASIQPILVGLGDFPPALGDAPPGQSDLVRALKAGYSCANCYANRPLSNGCSHSGSQITTIYLAVRPGAAQQIVISALGLTGNLQCSLGNISTSSNGSDSLRLRGR